MPDMSGSAREIRKKLDYMVEHEGCRIQNQTHSDYNFKPVHCGMKPDNKELSFEERFPDIAGNTICKSFEIRGKNDIVEERWERDEDGNWKRTL